MAEIVPSTAFTAVSFPSTSTSNSSGLVTDSDAVSITIPPSVIPSTEISTAGFESLVNTGTFILTSGTTTFEVPKENQENWFMT